MGRADRGPRLRQRLRVQASQRGTRLLLRWLRPRASEGQLIVSSMPMGATVEIEGHAGQQWKAPQTVPGLAAGTYKVTFNMPGYATETRTVQVSGGARTPLDVRMVAVKGFVTVASKPAGAASLDQRKRYRQSYADRISSRARNAKYCACASRVILRRPRISSWSRGSL